MSHLHSAPIAKITVNIHIDDTYDSAVDVEELVRVIKKTIRRNNVDMAELTLTITNDETVHALNKQYRSVDAPTDVLSFAAREQAGDQNSSDSVDFVLPPELQDEMADYLGDIIIAYPYAERQAGQLGNSVAAELRLLAVHGTLHLLGYDHDTAESEAKMWAMQEEVLAPFGDHNLSGRSHGA